ncbi:MAG: DUF2911 domain-containing protein, partial [Pyrinomonadaceae bacterium]
MKRILTSHLSVIALLLISASFVSAQLRLPRPSPKASVMQTIGVTDVSITYNRPAVKGRKIWGDAPADSYAKGEATLDDQNKRPPGMPIVPFGHVWRTGANEATQFVVTDDVLINGQALAAGTYSLHTIPGKDEWTIVFNGTANQWGSFNYDPKNDTLRVKAKPATVTDNQEMLAFSIEPTSESAAQVNIRWERLRVPFIVEVKDVSAVALAKARIAVAAAKSNDWQTPLNAANYAKNNKSTEEASKWFDQAIRAIDEQIAAKGDFLNLARKTSILASAGRTQDAIATGEKA